MADVDPRIREDDGKWGVPMQPWRGYFPRSLFNLLTAYAGAVDSTRCFMNRSTAPELVFEQQGQQRHIDHPELFDHLMKEAGL